MNSVLCENSAYFTSDEHQLLIKGGTSDGGVVFVSCFVQRRVIWQTRLRNGKSLPNGFQNMLWNTCWGSLMIQNWAMHPLYLWNFANWFETYSNKNVWLLILSIGRFGKIGSHCLLLLTQIYHTGNLRKLYRSLRKKTIKGNFRHEIGVMVFSDPKDFEFVKITDQTAGCFKAENGLLTITGFGHLFTSDIFGIKFITSSVPAHLPTAIQINL